MALMVEEPAADGPRRGLSGRVRRVLVLLVLAAAGVATGRLVVVLLDDAAPTAARTRPPASASVAAAAQPQVTADRGRSVRRASAVLHAWDARRSSAYARGDPAALRRLYVPGSRAGARDLRVLRAYVARGLVVRGVRTQLLSLEVLDARDGALRVGVTDRRVGGRAVGRSVRAPLPRDAPSSTVVELLRHSGGWRVGAVQDA